VIGAEAESFRKPRRPGDAFARYVVKNSNKHEQRHYADHYDGHEQNWN